MVLLKHALPILLRPTFEWSAISAKTITPFKLFLGYIIPLSAIRPVASTILIVEFVHNNPSIQEEWVGFYWKSAFPNLIAYYVWQLMAIYLLAHFVNCIAPLFARERNYPLGLKVLGFALTPIWFGEIFIAIPVFSLDTSMRILSLFYSGYLLYLGLSILMNVSSPKVLLYTGIVAVALWGTSKAPRIAVSIDEYFRQHVLDQNTKTVIVVLLILSVVGLTVLYQRYGKAVRQALLYTGMVAVALWGTSKAPRIAVAIDEFFRRWPSFDESTKTMIVVLLILSVVGLTVLYERYCKKPRSNFDD